MPLGILQLSVKSWLYLNVKMYVKTEGSFNFKEDELIGTKVEELGIGRFISEWVWRGRLSGTMRR